MILGFDNDCSDIVEMQRAFLQDNNILHAMVGMLSAIPPTPLYQRLLAEGRLGEKEASRYGTNVIPKNLSREELKNGYVDLMRYFYDIEPYFERLNGLILDPEFRIAPKGDYWKSRRP